MLLQLADISVYNVVICIFLYLGKKKNLIYGSHLPISWYQRILTPSQHRPKYIQPSRRVNSMIHDSFIFSSKLYRDLPRQASALPITRT